MLVEEVQGLEMVQATEQASFENLLLHLLPHPKERLLRLMLLR